MKILWKHHLKANETYGEFWKHFETDYLQKPFKAMGNLKTLWNRLFENHWNLWRNLKPLWNTSFWKPLKPMRKFENTSKHIILKPIETHHFGNTLKHIILKTIDTYGEFWKHFETHHFENHWNLWQFLKTLWNTLFWKPLKPMRKFENSLKHINFGNTLKHIILKTIETYGDFWKHFETHHFENHWNLWGILKTLWNTSFEKPLKPMRKFENTLKHIIWKPFKPMGEIWKHPTDTLLSHGHSGVTFENLGFQLALKWNTWVCAIMHGEKNLLFSRCWKYRLHYYRVKQ